MAIHSPYVAKSCTSARCERGDASHGDQHMRSSTGRADHVNESNKVCILMAVLMAQTARCKFLFVNVSRRGHHLKRLPSIEIYKTQPKFIRLFRRFRSSMNKKGKMAEPEVISRVQNKPEHLVSDGDWSRPRDVPTAIFL